MDRNTIVSAVLSMYNLSLSARRAWIEILFCVGFCLGVKVALRKESVDRNNIRNPAAARPSIVALRKESVDRNISPRSISCMILSRSPQGERG